MARVTLIEILLFLIPFATFFAYRAVSGRTDQPTPYQKLIIAGAALAVGGFLLGALLTQGAPGGSHYTPPRMENGKIVPGEFDEPDDPDGDR